MTEARINANAPALPVYRSAAPTSTPHPDQFMQADAPPPTVIPKLGIPLDTPWKQYVYQFAVDNLQHTAWGLQHSERDYLVASDLADKAHLPVDRDVLFAAAMLHDMGGFPAYEKPGVDHAVRSAEIVGDTVLKPAGFPSDKITAVQQAILHHSYYDPVQPTTPEGIALHDADALDFLGAISIARIVSLTERDPAAPNPTGAIQTLESLLKDAPKSLMLPESKPIGAQRAAELQDFLTRLNAESFDGNAL